MPRTKGGADAAQGAVSEKSKRKFANVDPNHDHFQNPSRFNEDGIERYGPLGLARQWVDNPVRQEAQLVDSEVYIYLSVKAMERRLSYDELIRQVLRSVVENKVLEE